MCGIFGLVASENSDCTIDKLERAIELLFSLSEPRGREASGLAISSDKRISIYKQAASPSAMLKTAGYRELFNKFSEIKQRPGLEQFRGPVAVIGHCRLVTNGSQAISENNQPIRVNHIVGIHNGIITNDTALSYRYLNDSKSKDLLGSSDSEVLLGLIDKWFKDEGSLAASLAKTYREISGSASIALLADSLPALILGTNTGSLYYSFEKQDGFFVFGSEHYIIEQFLKKSELWKNCERQPVMRLKSGEAALVDFNQVAPEIFSLKSSQDLSGSLWSPSRIKSFEILDTRSDFLLLRRCKKCVLPETYPFISFDEGGVCNYCQSYEKQKFHGSAALESELSKYRSKNGEPDCIVGFSGGRDSSYGLHLLKTEFGMNPIAYTYDWGLITDHARRNQARICGKLGIEQIIRAADISKKRRHIRKNIYAWLKNPELGMVPLFMAGDKEFYYYGRQLRKETRIRLTIFCAGHQVEQMEFKVGFCGINQNLKNNTKLYKYDRLVKIRLGLWYLKQYLVNPSYINESLFDSIFAYYSSFIGKDDFLYLYHYVPWDEKVIEQVLQEQYGWETDEKYGKNQWRMGDGQTAFIDYIYYAVAGFSEFDNFRSNQIREGLITREQGLDLLGDDNKPRIDSLQDFSQMIGFNLDEVLQKINTIPKLYSRK